MTGRQCCRSPLLPGLGFCLLEDGRELEHGLLLADVVLGFVVQDLAPNHNTPINFSSDKIFHHHIFLEENSFLTWSEGRRPLV
jgi:hypothetical protein